MKAVILLGGLGTRLRPFTLEKPKPLLPVLNKPFFAYQLDQLKRHGVREVVLAIGYQAAHFRRHLGDGRAWGVRFIYSVEDRPLGTGGAIRKALPHLSGTTFVLNGDIFCDIDLSDFLRAHRRHRAGGTLALTAVPDPSRYGLVETDPSGRVRRFVEKPSAAETTVDTINAGYYVFEPALIRQIPDTQPVSIERDVFPRLVKSGVPLHGYLHRGYWSDIGTLRSYWETHMDLLAGFRPAGRALRRLREGLWAGKNCRVTGPVKIQGRVLLGDGCRVASNAVFRGGVCLGPGCVVGENAVLTDCVVHAGTRIGANARLENCLVGERCRLGDDVFVGPNTVLANRSVIGAYSQQTTGLVRKAVA